MFRRHSFAAFVFTVCVFSLSATLVQSQVNKSKTSKPSKMEGDDEAAQRRAVATSLVTTLADEARTFKDQTRRARVQARAADVLWDTDPDRARELFRRAWDAAVIVDEETARARAEEMKKSADGPRILRGGPDIRSEVLRLAAKRDKKLGDEFLKILDDAMEKERTEAASATRRNSAESQLGASSEQWSSLVPRWIVSVLTRSFFFPLCAKKIPNSPILPLTTSWPESLAIHRLMPTRSLGCLPTS